MGVTSLEIDLKKVQEKFDNYSGNVAIASEGLEDILNALYQFCNNDTYSGDEADAVKAFIQDVEIPMAEDLWSLLNLLDESSAELLEDFNVTVDSSESAIVTESSLDLIKTDFKDFAEDFSEYATTIGAIYKKVNDACSDLQTFTNPAKATMENISTVDLGNAATIIPQTSGSTETVPEITKNQKTDFETFESNHENDIEDGHWKEIYDTVQSNLSICNGKLTGLDQFDDVTQIYTDLTSDNSGIESTEAIYEEIIQESLENASAELDSESVKDMTTSERVDEVSKVIKNVTETTAGIMCTREIKNVEYQIEGTNLTIYYKVEDSVFTEGTPILNFTAATDGNSTALQNLAVNVLEVEGFNLFFAVDSEKGMGVKSTLNEGNSTVIVESYDKLDVKTDAIISDISVASMTNYSDTNAIVTTVGIKESTPNLKVEKVEESDSVLEKAWDKVSSCVVNSAAYEWAWWSAEVESGRLHQLYIGGGSSAVLTDWALKDFPTLDSDDNIFDQEQEFNSSWYTVPWYLEMPWYYLLI